MGGKNIGLAGLSSLVKKMFGGGGDTAGGSGSKGSRSYSSGMKGKAGAKVKAVKGQTRGRKMSRTFSKKRAVAGSRARRRP